ncbi:toprim domain-containing protein [Levilactobacillus brevis]|uniref:toprim domain-containing protein n=1 Tax=Levilactobacillus brevis TaxID=1580 RepID=UPI0021A7C1B7|nr:toprim domain-containing protein [Levilactobacillus brevis]
MSEIQDYMDWAGITYEKSGHWIWPTDRDSMRVNLNKDYFNRFSTGVWGHLREFIAEHDDLTPVEAKKRLAEFQQANPQSRRVDRSTTVDSQPFDLSALHAERQLSTKCRDYLIKTRKIPTKLVDQLVQQGQIMEDTQHHNLVFPWYQGDKIVGADLQGTTYMKDPHQGRHYFKGIARHSAHDFGWAQVVGEGGAPTRAVICEAPIDAMSYGQLFAPQEPTLIVSLGGVEKTGVFANMVAERIGDHGGKIKELVLATDNDDAGRQFIQQFKDAGIQGNNGRVKVNVAIPHEKDWNDDLKAGQTAQQVISLDQFDNQMSKQSERAVKPVTTSKSPEEVSKESYTDKRRQEIAQYSKQVLAAARKMTRTPEDLLEMTDFMARFPQYSFHNQVLIKEQKAGALAVAGFTKFKQMGAKVQKGQHGIKIFAPNMVKHVKISDDWVPLNQVTNEQKQAAKKHQLLTKEFIKGYRLVTVFDVTQTTMKAADYPKIYPNRPYEFPSKPENIAELTQAVDEFARGQGITIQERTHLNSKSVAKGYYAPDAKAIVIQSGLPDSEKLKVRLHEMGHALLEHRADKVSRPIAELQAELTSAVVMKHCGINVEREAVPYISAWTDHLQKLDERQFGQQMTIINDVNRASRKIIEGIDPRYQELEKSRAQTIVQKAPTLEKPGMEPLDMGIQRQHSLSR